MRYRIGIGAGAFGGTEPGTVAPVDAAWMVAAMASQAGPFASAAATFEANVAVSAALSPGSVGGSTIGGTSTTGAVIHTAVATSPPQYAVIPAASFGAPWPEADIPTSAAAMADCAAAVAAGTTDAPEHVACAKYACQAATRLVMAAASDMVLGMA